MLAYHFRSSSMMDALFHSLSEGTPWAFLALALLTLCLLAALWHSRARAEAVARKLQKEETRLRAIVRVMPDLMMVLDEDGRYLELYTMDEQRLVAPRAAMLGHTLSECLPPDSARFIQETLRRALESRHVLTVEYPLDVRAGRLWLEARVTALDEEIDGKRCVLWVSRDITERRRQEEALRQGQKLESLGVLAGDLAHDLNNLLLVVQGNLNLMQVQMPRHTQMAKYLPRAEGAIRRASELAGQMLAYSGRAAYRTHATDISQILEEMKGTLRGLVPRRVEVTLRLATALPPVQCDRGRFRQLLTNLVTNAGEAIGDQDGHITISTGLVELDQAHLDANFPGQPMDPGLHATLEVGDSGCGMEADLLRRIFDPFFTTKRSGRGLGLSTASGILKAHRGGVIVWTQPGQGSIFKLFLPVRPEAASPQPSAAGDGRRDLFEKSVLLVEEEPEVRGTVREMLELLGATVKEAGEGLRSISQLMEEAASVDLVLLDLNLTLVDGAEVLRALRERAPGRPVLFSSGHRGQDSLEQLLRDPAVGFLPKPYTLKQLQQALDGVLGPVEEVTQA